MKKFFVRIKNDDGGEVMIESTIIIFITISVMLVMISLGFLFYQQAMIKTIANEIAEGIASSYKYSARSTDFHVSQISSTDVNELHKYRSTLNYGQLESDYELIASEYVKDRVALTNLGLNSSDPEINLDFKPSNVARIRVEVVVSLESDFLFSGLLESLDIIDSTPTFEAGATAECIDLTSLTGTVNFQRYLYSKLGGGVVDDIATIITDAKEIYNTMFT
ncbi:MAG: hypothetical protein PHP22_06440 [Oscillospiraceae bacterium]|nr:hypothetical protein [Oscillospiraceae bacterium]